MTLSRVAALAVAALVPAGAYVPLRGPFVLTRRTAQISAQWRGGGGGAWGRTARCYGGGGGGRYGGGGGGGGRTARAAAAAAAST